ncbi:MAG: ankyrin repeat domain-containing protein [Sedimentisphaerales bacterium]|nr:ankyrin repeat domain-containing protein [Sedimentisphaerales bacterium]
MRRQRFLSLVVLLVITTPGCRKQAAPSTTALHRAASACDIRSIELLISHGADVNARDWHGHTPLHHVAARQTTHSNLYWTPSSKDTVAALIGHGAQIDAKDRYGRTPLHYALRSGDEDVVRLLVASGASVSAADNKGNTSLHLAARRGSADIADLLIARGADVHARDRMGSTPLHAATVGTRDDLIARLLARGADINATDKKGRTPVEYAAQGGNFQCVEFLVSKGAKVASSSGGDRARGQDPVGAMAAVAQPNVKTAVQGNSAFACSLYGRLRSAQGNLFFSPYSISTALAMTYAGARGDTERQMAETLRFSLDQQDLHPAMAALQGWLGQVQKQGSVRLHVANSLWPHQGYPFLQQYLSLTKQFYGVAITPVDYVHAPEATRSQINQWIGEKTEHRITNMIQPGLLNALTRLVLVNAIYFKGQWSEQFDPRNTKPQPFRISKEQSTPVPMMSQTARAGYAELDTAQVLALPYRGDSLSMLIVLPREIDALSQLEESLSVEVIDSWRGQLHAQKVRVFLPKFTMTRQFRVDATLKSMGMTDAFNLRLADFSGMTGSRELFIDAVVHKAFVEVNEEGTEATAATVVAVAKKAMPSEPPMFRADHPFLFLIQENHTGSILFIGRLTDPTQTASP